MTEAGRKPGLGRACGTAATIAAQAGGSRLHRVLLLLGLLLLIVHCRPWSYTAFGAAEERHATQHDPRWSS